MQSICKVGKVSALGINCTIPNIMTRPTYRFKRFPKLILKIDMCIH